MFSSGHFERKKLPLSVAACAPLYILGSMLHECFLDRAQLTEPPGHTYKSLGENLCVCLA